MYGPQSRDDPFSYSERLAQSLASVAYCLSHLHIVFDCPMDPILLITFPVLTSLTLLGDRDSLVVDKIRAVAFWKRHPQLKTMCVTEIRGDTWDEHGSDSNVLAPELLPNLKDLDVRLLILGRPFVCP